MTLSGVERALGVTRIYLVERATQNDAVDDRSEKLAQTIAACLREAKEPHQETPQDDPKLSRDELRCAIRFVNNNRDSKLKWDQMAAAVGLDRLTFGRGFKLATGMTPHQYIIRCRIRWATRLLAREGLTLADVALEVGGSCQSHLTTLFRKHLGTTRSTTTSGRTTRWAACRQRVIASVCSPAKLQFRPCPLDRGATR